MTGLADTAAWDRTPRRHRLRRRAPHAPLRVRRRPLPRSRSTPSTDRAGHVLTWVTQGNGGGTSGGTYTGGTVGGRWQIGGGARRHRARHQRGRPHAHDPRRRTTRAPAGSLLTHTALDSSVTTTGPASRAPSASPTPPASVTRRPRSPRSPTPATGGCSSSSSTAPATASSSPRSSRTVASRSATATSNGTPALRRRRRATATSPRRTGLDATRSTKRRARRAHRAPTPSTSPHRRRPSR